MSDPRPMYSLDQEPDCSELRRESITDTQLKLHIPEPRIRPVLDLPTPADLSQESFKWAASMLKERGDQPQTLCAAEERLSRELIAWLWDNWRGVSYWTLPGAALVTPNSWVLQGYQFSVISRMP